MGLLTTSSLLYAVSVLVLTTQQTASTKITLLNENAGLRSLKLKELDLHGSPALGRLIFHLARASRRASRATSRCTAVLADSRYYSSVPSPRLARVSPVLLTYLSMTNTSYNITSQTLHALQEARHHGCQVIVILLHNGRELLRIIRKADRLRLLEARAHLIMPRDTRLFVPELHELWRRLVNVVFVRHRGRCFELSTVSFPASPDLEHPETWLPRPIDLWCDGWFKFGHPIFPDKTKNLKEGYLRVAYYPHMPSAVEINSEIKPALLGTSLHGVEIELVSLLSRAMNFRAALVQVHNASEGVIEALQTSRADVALGTLAHISHFLRRVDLSQPYASYCYTFLTPEALGDLSWYTLLLPFKPDLWHVTVVTFVVAWLALHAVARLQVERSVFTAPVPSLMNTWGMQMLVSVASPPRGWPLRLLFGCVWLHCLLLSVVYRASFSAQLARPPPRFAVDTLQQLAGAKHITPLVWVHYARDLLSSSQDEHGEDVGSRIQVTRLTESEVAAEVSRGRTAFFENVHVLHHIRRRYSGGSYRLHVMQECVSTLPISLGLSRNSPLSSRVNLILRHAEEMGLLSKWLRDATSSSPAGRDTEAPKQQQALVSLPKLASAMVALLAGYVLGCLTLMVELIYFYRSRITKCHRPNKKRNELSLKHDKATVKQLPFLK